MRRARVVHAPIKSSLANLPISLYGPLLQRNVRPQALAVHLVRTPASSNGRPPTSAYVGWTGLASASSLAHFNRAPGAGGDRGMETIELDPQFASDLGFAEGDVVEIGLLHDLPVAAAVGAEPVSVDDWEIIELHAAHLESTLLSQVRVAAVGQQVDVWVLGRTRVRLRVVSIDGSTAPKTASLLSTNTEVSVAPKVRSSTSTSRALPNGRATSKSAAATVSEPGLSNGITSGAAPAQKPKSSKPPTVLRVLPTSFLPLYLRPHGSTLVEENSPEDVVEDDDDGPVVAYVSPRTFALMNPSTPPTETTASKSSTSTSTSTQTSAPACYRTLARRLRPPVPPSTTTSSSSATSPAAEPAPKVLKASGTGSGDPTDGNKTHAEVEVLVYPATLSTEGGELPCAELEGEVSSWLPDEHVVFKRGASQERVGAGECDLVRFNVIRGESIPDHGFALSSSSSPVSSSSGATSLAIPPLAGTKDTLVPAQRFCTNAIFASCITGPFALGKVPGLLITGNTGVGKTTLLRALASSLQAQVVRQDHEGRRLHLYPFVLYVNVAEYAIAPSAQTQNANQTPTALRALFEHWLALCLWHRPSVLLLDNLDALLSAEVEHADSFRARHLTELFLAAFSSPSFAPFASSLSWSPSGTGSLVRRPPPPGRLVPHGITLVASASSQQALHPLLNTQHVFMEVLKIKPLGREARRDILAQIVQTRIAASPADLRVNSDSEQGASISYAGVASETDGYSASDLQDLVARAVHQALVRTVHAPTPGSTSREVGVPTGPITLTTADFDTAREGFVPISLRNVKLEKSEVSWADIGGLHETRRILRETLEWPTKYGPIFAKSPLRLRSGLLLYGFPGCGKTLLASAVARECGLNFISVKGPELLNKYIGASEKSVRDIFERASAAKPCVLFFDEFDSIAPKRGHDSTGVTDRVVNQMLTQMDGAEGLEGVYVLAATSRPDLIDGALLRPGRLDKSLLCNMPDAGERLEILQAVSRKVKLSPSVDLAAFAEQTEGYSGADLQALVYNAHLEIIHETIAARKESADRSSSHDRDHDRSDAIVPKEHLVTNEHLARSLETTRPSVPDDERERLSRIYRAFVSERSGELPVPPDGGSVGNRVSLM